MWIVCRSEIQDGHHDSIWFNIGTYLASLVKICSAVSKKKSQMWKANEKTDDGRLPMTKAHMANGQVSYKEYQNQNKYFRCWSVLTPYDPFYLGNIVGMVTRVRLFISFSHLTLLLWNRWTDFNQTCQTCSLGGPLPDLCFWCRSEIQHPWQKLTWPMARWAKNI
jgi:hypothetical protein